LKISTEVLEEFGVRLRCTTGSLSLPLETRLDLVGF